MNTDLRAGTQYYSQSNTMIAYTENPTEQLIVCVENCAFYISNSCAYFGLHGCEFRTKPTVALIQLFANVFARI